MTFRTPLPDEMLIRPRIHFDVFETMRLTCYSDDRSRSYTGRLAWNHFWLSYEDTFRGTRKLWVHQGDFEMVDHMFGYPLQEAGR